MDIIIGALGIIGFYAYFTWMEGKIGGLEKRMKDLQIEMKDLKNEVDENSRN